MTQLEAVSVGLIVACVFVCRYVKIQNHMLYTVSNRLCNIHTYHFHYKLYGVAILYSKFFQQRRSKVNFSKALGRPTPVDDYKDDVTAVQPAVSAPAPALAQLQQAAGP